MRGPPWICTTSRPFQPSGRATSRCAPFASWPRQQVVVLSNYATQDIRRRCVQLGADAVFDKSNEIDALLDFCLAQSSDRASNDGA